jgi:hypothetical protein
LFSLASVTRAMSASSALPSMSVKGLLNVILYFVNDRYQLEGIMIALDDRASIILRIKKMMSNTARIRYFLPRR